MIKNMKKIMSQILIVCVFLGTLNLVDLQFAYAASDNTTTILSNVKNSKDGEISFTIKAPGGFDTYYQVVAKNAKTIMNSQSSLSTDVDNISGKVLNKTGTSTKTQTVTVKVKLYGEYIVKVGVGGYYNSNSALRQSAAVMSKFIGSRQGTKLWTTALRDKYKDKEELSLSLAGDGVVDGVTMLINSSMIGGVISLAYSCYVNIATTHNAILNITQSTAPGEYVGLYFEENSAGTGVTVYYTSFDKNKKMKSNKVALKTVLYSGYIPTL